MSRLVRCPRCGAQFTCQAEPVHRCGCGDFVLPPVVARVMAETYDDCLCPKCLGEVSRAETYVREDLVRLAETIRIMERLRAECPWDAKQTVESLRQYSIEEVFELADAIINHDDSAITKELGDILMHILFYTSIGREHGRFTLNDVVRTQNTKLIYRHPHVYGEHPTQDADEVERRWEQLKLKEKDGNRSVLAGVPRSLPPLIKAMRVQEKGAAAGFDWTHREDVWPKVEEELQEVREAVQANDPVHMAEEFGDVLFALINAARLYGVDPDSALEASNRKFIRRFNHIEARAKALGRDLPSMSLAEMDTYWDEAKRLEREVTPE